MGGGWGEYGGATAVPGPSNEKARVLRALHAQGTLVLPNAWDAASAALLARAGAAAIATTSGGVAWSLGRPDGERLTRAEMVAAIGRIAAAVDVPVTADVESGYGPAPADVAETVRAVVAAGAVGINLEDSPGDGLFPVEAAAERVRAARAAAEAAGLPDLVVNARTDVVLRHIGDPAGRLAEIATRADRYAAAGADCLFVPGLLDLDALRELVARSPLPVNVLADPGGPTVAELAAVGVRRVSSGTSIAQAAYGAAQRAATTLLREGRVEDPGGVSYGDVNGALS